MPDIGGLGSNNELLSQTLMKAAQQKNKASSSATDEVDGGYERKDVQYERQPVAASSKAMSISDFYKLIAAQFQYQDPQNPADTSDMMASMVQGMMMTAMDNMSSTINDLSISNLTAYAASMMGKEVTIAEVDDDGKYTGETTKGTVTGVQLGTTPWVCVNGKNYLLSQLMSIGEVAEEPTDKDENQGEGGENGPSDAGSDTPKV
ncbi:MAG: hypothetical protein HFE83_10675 [Lachnospiraceae bacterium]|nr:hypothetical protein [Lachnospiraceae bacterium]